MSLTKQEIDAIARRVVRLQDGPPFIPFDEWYNAWQNYCLDGAYTIRTSLRALQEWLIEYYLDGEEGVVHLGPISRKQAEEDVHWAIESFNNNEWPEYCELEEMLDDLAAPPFDKFDDEVKYIEFSCYL